MRFGRFGRKRWSVRIQWAYEGHGEWSLFLGLGFYVTPFSYVAELGLLLFDISVERGRDWRPGEKPDA